jgi:hypothetical protein
MLRHEVLVTTDVLEEHITSIIRAMEAIHSSETSVLTRATWRNIPEAGILHKQQFPPKILYKGLPVFVWIWRFTSNFLIWYILA